MPEQPPKVYPYLTVEEMREYREFMEAVPDQGGGSRFEGSTVPDLALQYFSHQDNLLECGPHFGYFTAFLQEQGFRNLHALDFINLLHFPDQHKLSFQECDFNTESMPYPEHHFDGATAWGLAEHLENPFHFVREIWRVLKPDGVFLLSLPNVHHLSSRIGFLKSGVFPRWNLKSNHITLLPKGVIEKTVFRYFAVEKIIYSKPGTMVTRRPKTAIRRGLDKLSTKVLPANELFGNYIAYVLRRKETRDPPRFL